MSWGTLTVGSLVLSETHTVDDKVNANDKTRAVALTGQEMSFGSSLAIVQAKAEDLVLLMDRVLPVTFSRKTERNGYYRVVDAGVTSTYWVGEGSFFTWTLSLELVGPDNAVDVESRMSHVVRSNVGALAGERWHAPAIGHYGYFLGAVAPSSIVRNGADGPMTVYRSIPQVNPRWGSPVGSFLSGRSRFLSGGIIRAGVGINVLTTGWELQNGLVRVRPATTAGTTLFIAFWDGAAWQERPWDVRVAGSSLVPSSHFIALTVLRNDPEGVRIRVLASQPSNGNRVTLDLTLRRGSRFVEGYIQRTTAGDFSVAPDVGETGLWTTGSPYVSLIAPDDVGLVLTTGSSRAVSAFSSGGFTVSSTTTLDFYIGAEVMTPPLGTGNNFGFETGALGGWSPTGATAAVRNDGPKYGTYYGRITATGGVDAKLFHGTSGTNGTPGKQYTISGWLRSPVTLTASQARLELQWYNVGVYLSNSVVNAPALTANVWTPVSGSAIAPASTTAIARQAMLLAASAGAGAILDVDQIEIRETTQAGDAVADLYNQYLAVPNEKAGVIAR